MVAIFLLSLSLNRTFLIDMSWPCSIENYIESNFIEWSINKHRFFRQHVASTIRLNQSNLRSFDDLKTFDQTYSIIEIDSKNIFFFRWIDQQAELHQSLFDRFRLQRRFIEINFVYPLFYQLLIKFKTNINNELQKFYNQRTNNVPLTCAHIRIGRNPSNPKDMIFPHREKMAQTILKFISSRSGEIFISTDSIDVYNLSKTLFSNKNSASTVDRRLIEINGTIGHIDRDTVTVGCQALPKTILDFHVLSLCDFSVISKSSFSYLATLRRTEPYRDLFLYCNGIRRVRHSNDYDKFVYATC